MKLPFTANKKSGLDKYIKAGFKLTLILLFLYIGIILTIGGICIIAYFKSSSSQEYQMTDIIATTGTLGDTLGGVLGPLIALIAALLTFWAFMVQIEANQQQREQFEKQFVDQQKNNFESRFFELLKIHRENVNNIDSRFDKKNGFEIMYKELEYFYVLQFNITFDHNYNEMSYRIHDEWIGDRLNSVVNKIYIDALFEKEFKAIQLSIEILMKGYSYQTYLKYNNQLQNQAIMLYISELARLESIKTDLMDAKDTDAYLELMENYKKEVPGFEMKNIQRRFVYLLKSAAYEITIDLTNNKYAMHGYSELITPYFSNLLYLIEYVDKNVIVISGEDDDETKKKNIDKVREGYFKLINLQMSRYELYLLYYYYIIKYFGEEKNELIKTSKILESITDDEINFSVKPWYLFNRI